MHLTLANRICISVVGVIILALLSSIVALLSCWHVGELMYQVVFENLPAVKAAEELEIAVLEQRGFVSSYLLDNGNREWLSELEKRKANFHNWLRRAHQTARTGEEHKILTQLERVYLRYDAQRDQAVKLYEHGEVSAAGSLLVNEVHALYQRAYDLCEMFILANEQLTAEATARAQRRIHWVTWAVAGCVSLTMVLGALLLWLFFHGVVLPIRTMVAEARGFAGQVSSERNGLAMDELHAVGIYLQNLVSDVADTRTTLERSRQELKVAEKLASVGKLAASVAHEIRNPLTSLKMWLFSIQKEVNGPPDLDRKFNLVSSEIRRLENIVRNFLEFSRFPELRLSLESMATILDKALELMKPHLESHQIELLRQDTPGLPLVQADSEQLNQVLLNLLNNAIEAMGDGGQILVISSAKVDSQGRTMVVVQIADGGPGIPDEIVRRIFDPFFSTKENGTGLGLSIAARIVARHEGRLVLESSGPNGSTFGIHIPAASEAIT